MLDDFFFFPRLWDGSQLERIRPADSDVYETDSEIVVKVAVPGVNPDDINIQVSGNTVTISGETRDEQEDSGKNFYQKQLRYGKFSQSVVIPTTIQVDKAEANFRNGILTLTLPKSEAVRSKQIKVKVEDKPKKLN
jgi:HSP20 family protein